MALRITDDCINCDACIYECPNTAIYEPNEKWTFADGTSLVNLITKPDGEKIDALKEQNAIAEDFYFIVTDKCTECKGFHKEAQCAAVCPVDCIIIDEGFNEGEEDLLKKKAWLHKDL